MMKGTKKGSSGNVFIGLFCGAVAGLIQGAVEAFWILTPGRAPIVGPSDILEFLLPRAIRRVLPGPEIDSLPLVLDVYIGPDIMDRLSVLLRVLALYTFVGVLAGGGLWLIWSALRRLWLGATQQTRAWPFYVSALVCIGVVTNLLAYLSHVGILETGAFAGAVIVVSLMGNAIWLWPWLYRTLDRSIPAPAGTSTSALRRAISTVAAALLVGTVVAGSISAVMHVDKSTSAYPALLLELASGEEPPTGPNILLISIDSLRADHLSSYGYDRQTSPNIDQLAAEGILFSQAVSTTSWTLPSHASLLTGLLPEAHGVVRPRHILAEWPHTLAELLAAQGYLTAAFVSAPFLSSDFGMDQGFDLYDDESVHFSTNADSHSGATSPMIHEAVSGWLRANHEERFFLFVHYWDVHYDYDPPSPYDRLFDPDYEGDLTAQAFESNPRIRAGMPARDLQHIEALYDGEIAYTDEYIGKLLDLLDELNLADDTLVILTSDHGDEFFEHGRKGHYKNLHEESLRIPLIVRLPGRLPAGLEVDDVASLVDIAPTILDLVGVESEARPPMQGRSLLPLISGDDSAGNTHTAYASFLNRQTAVRSSHNKYIYRFHSDRGQLYDLTNDPLEQVDLIAEGDPIADPEVRSAIDRLLDWLNLQREFRRSVPAAALEATSEIDPKVLQELRSLGYID